ncbi:Unknown protein, partial [Striga hermonthica]
LFSNTTPLFDVDNIYISPHRVLKQNGTLLTKSRKIRVNRGKYEKCKQHLWKDLFSNTAPLFDVGNIYLSPHCVLNQNGTRLTKSRKIRVNMGKYEKCKQRLRKDLFSNTTTLYYVDNIYLSPHRVLNQNATHLRKSRKIRVNRGKYEKRKHRLQKDLFSNTTPLFDLDNIYLSPHRVLKQNGTHLRKSRKIRVNRAKYEKCKQRFRKDLFSNTPPLFDVGNIYLLPHRVLINGTCLRKSIKISVNRGKYKKCKQRLRKDLFTNTTPLFDVDNLYDWKKSCARSSSNTLGSTMSIHGVNNTDMPNKTSVRHHHAWVKDRRVTVLVDNGSSHNFINADLSQKLNLPTTKIEPFEVRVTNGERLQCTESFRKVPIKFQGVTVKVDLYALPLVGPGVVLGVQWLKGLGK